MHELAVPLVVVHTVHAVCVVVSNGTAHVDTVCVGSFVGRHADLCEMQLFLHTANAAPVLLLLYVLFQKLGAYEVCSAPGFLDPFP